MKKILKGIDVSSNNGLINWELVKNQIDFVMIRVSFGQRTLDNKFNNNIESCIKYNIPFGIYVYSYALNLAQAVNEANFAIKNLEKYKKYVTFPIAIDMEDADGYKQKNGFPSDEMLQLICETECEIFSEAGFIPMIYASKSWFDTKLNSKYLNFEKWLAWWNEKAEFDKTKYTIWQYSSKGKIQGIDGYIDLNYAYKDYRKENESMPNVYNSLKEIPAYAKNTIKLLFDKGFLQGNEYGLDLDERMIRTFVVLDRAGIFDKLK